MVAFVLVHQTQMDRRAVGPFDQGCSGYRYAFSISVNTKIGMIRVVFVW
jgi:hypothetical protein